MLLIGSLLLVKQSTKDKVRDKSVEYLVNEGITRSEAISKALKELKQEGKVSISSINGSITRYLVAHQDIYKKVKARQEGIVEGDGDGSEGGDGDGSQKTEVKGTGTQTQVQKPKKKIVKNNSSDPPSVKTSIDYIGAFQTLDTGSTPTDLMLEHNLDPDQLIMVIEKWNKIKEKMWEKDAVEAKYVPAWYEISRTMGEQVRDGCEHYQDENGLCDYWNFTKADSEFRKKYSGMFKTDGGKLRPRVGEHPEICATCQRGLAFSTTAAS